MEGHDKGIEDLIGDSTGEEESRSRRLAIVLLTVRELLSAHPLTPRCFQKELQHSEAFSRECSVLSLSSGLGIEVALCFRRAR